MSASRDSRWDDPRYLDYVGRWPEPFLPYECGEDLGKRAEAARLRGDFGWDLMVNGFPERRTAEGGSNP